MTEYLREQLRDAIRREKRKPLIVCGAGVSIQATARRAPTWAKLIESGIRRVADLDSNASSWAASRIEALPRAETYRWIEIADELTERLGGVGNAEFKTWLRDSVGSLTIMDRQLVDAIVGLECPIATLALFRGEHAVAESNMDEALRLARKLGSIRTEALAIESLGSLALHRNDLPSAKRYFGEAAALFRRVYGRDGESDSAGGLAQVAYLENDYDTALTLFEKARAGSHALGRYGSEAECLVRLGLVYRKIGKAELGLTAIREGFELYFAHTHEHNLMVPGFRALRDMLLSADATESERHREVARSTWLSIGRLDLVNSWIDQLALS